MHHLHFKLLVFGLILQADWQLGTLTGAAGKSLKDAKNVNGTGSENINNQKINKPVELTHLFLNKDGTLDDSLLFHAHSTNVRQSFKTGNELADTRGISSSADSSSEGGTSGSSGNSVNKHKNGNKIFLSKNNTVIKAHAGSTVVLPCMVNKDSKFEMIMWVRQLKGANRSYQILTIGDSPHINDNRFFLTASTVDPHKNDWSLSIQRVNTSDSGAYKCQANSHPSQFITTSLSVHEAFAYIEGPKEKFIKVGSTLILNCTFQNITETPAFVFWYHNGRMISHDRSRGRNVRTEAGYSLLELPKVNAPLDSGNYSCEPQNLFPDRVTVHILGSDGGNEFSETAAAAVHTSDEAELPIASKSTITTLESGPRFLTTIVAMSLVLWCYTNSW